MTKRIQGSLTAICAQSGCFKIIREGSWNFTSGLCVEHQPKPAPVPERTDLRRVTVHLTPGCSTLPATHHVTLPRFPWEAA